MLSGLLWVFLSVSSAWGQQCLSRSTSDQLAAELVQAETAFSGMDVKAFQFAIQEAALSLPCLSERISADTAAHYHRIVALRLYMGGDEKQAIMSLAGAKHIQSTYAFPVGLFPEGHPFVEAYVGLELTEQRSKRALRPRQGTLLFDAVPTLDRPMDRATLVQLIDEANAPVFTTYLMPNQSLPPYKGVARTRIRLILAAGAAVLLAGGMYGLGWWNRARFDAYDPSYTDKQLKGLQQGTNALFGLAGTFAIVAIAGGAGAIAVGEK